MKNHFLVKVWISLIAALKQTQNKGITLFKGLGPCVKLAANV